MPTKSKKARAALATQYLETMGLTPHPIFADDGQVISAYACGCRVHPEDIAAVCDAHRGPLLGRNMATGEYFRLKGMI